MDELKNIYVSSPYDDANYCSRFFFCWLIPLMWKGYRIPVEIEDLLPVPKGSRSEYLGNLLEPNWRKELRKKKPSLLRALFATFGIQFVLFGTLAFVEECGTHIAQPICLGMLIRYFTPGSDMSLTEAYIYATAIVLGSVFYAFTHHPYFFGTSHLGMKLRLACSSLIYRKILRLSKTGMEKTTAGQMVNLLSNDVNRFDMGVAPLHYLWIGPLQAVLSAYILWLYLQEAAFVGMLVIVVLLPLQSYMGRLSGKFRLQTAKMTDQRICVTNELVGAMRIIKMYVWETPFSTKVEEARKSEVRILMKTATIRAVNMALYAVTSKFVLFITFVTYLFLGGTLTAENVFVSVAIYNNVRMVMTYYFPLAVSQGAEIYVSIKRIKRFLLLEDRIILATGRRQSEIGGHSKIRLESVSAAWGTEATLKNLTFEVKEEELFAIIGHVGAGKTSLLMTLLRELPVKSGYLRVSGTVAYASQEPWIFQASVRQNIVMGAIFNERRYREVLRVCALTEDMLQLPFGDQTLVGERGAALSGGQRARINLARAVYAGADIYLLDDPFSAVDAEVGKHLFDKCISRHLRDKVRILVTHHLKYLQSADQIMILRDGECIALGKYRELVARGFNMEQLAAEIEEANERRMSTVSQKSFDYNDISDSQLQDGTDTDSVVLQLLAEETRKKGHIAGTLYWHYLRAGGSAGTNILLIVLILFSHVLFNACEYWLSYWTKSIQNRSAEEKESGSSFETEKENIYIYSFLMVCLFVFSLFRCGLFCFLCLNASVQLHKRMFYAVLRSPIIFFDINPVGRILNRFSRDVSTLDELLPICLDDASDIALKVIGIVVLVALTNYWILIPTVFLAIIFWTLRRFYLRTVREVKRLDSITRSPIFSHLSSTLYGLSTLRAFRGESRFLKEFEAHLDINSAAWFHFISTSRWLAIYLDWLTIVFIAITVYSVMLTDGVMGGDVGLAISVALGLSGMFQWGVRQSAEVESQMVSVERIMEYSNLPSEAALEGPERPPPEWPQKGVIEFVNVNLYYENDHLILRNLSFVIHAAEKIGIVGRTGAGKSSVIAALFRLTEPEGVIRIDGVNVLEIGLHDLRKIISIIPQEPTLFNASLRFNLDPKFEHSDNELWATLFQVQLKDFAIDLPDGLNSMMSEGGTTISIGQRQLICLARAILQKNKILVMDEATANIDMETDQHIQTTMREKFRLCTVLTIAHRLNTIIDSDRVMVLQAGEIVEFDEPYMLLQNRNSYFSELISQTGKGTSNYLRTLAKKKYDSKRI